jgi:hypothetical protein
MIEPEWTHNQVKRWPLMLKILDSVALAPGGNFRFEMQTTDLGNQNSWTLEQRPVLLLCPWQEG